MATLGTFKLHIETMPGVGPEQFEVPAFMGTLIIRPTARGAYISVIDESGQPKSWYATEIIGMSFLRKVTSDVA